MWGGSAGEIKRAKQRREGEGIERKEERAKESIPDDVSYRNAKGRPQLAAANSLLNTPYTAAFL